MLTNVSKPKLARQQLSLEEFQKFSDFIYARCGIRMNENKILLLTNRIRRRLGPSETESFDEYFRYLKSSRGNDEIENFLDVITTNETFFFRTQKHFDWLTGEFMNQVVADHRAGKRPDSLSIWSAGCSTGAEPYSIAMSIAEISYRIGDWKTQILGTDISEQVLNIARKGEFNARAMASVDARRQRRFFRHDADHDMWTVRPQIRSMVDFRQHNLIQEPLLGGFDCIFLCNVLIYFDNHSKKTVVNHVLKALADGGYLILGPSEGVSDMLNSLQKVTPLIYRKID